MAKFLKSLIQTGAKVAEKAAPIIGGALGGPAGAAGGKVLAGGISKLASNPKLGGAGAQGPGSFTPSTAGSVEEARTQDKNRMRTRYPGLMGSGTESS